MIVCVNTALRVKSGAASGAVAGGAAVVTGAAVIIGSYVVAFEVGASVMAVQLAETVLFGVPSMVSALVHLLNLLQLLCIICMV